MTRLVVPLPGVAAGDGPFHVEHCPVNVGGRSGLPSGDRHGLFVAPLMTDTPYALAIRQHEYGHLGLLRRGIVPHYTLDVLARDGVHELWAQGGLDVIVNAYMLAQGNEEIAQLKPWQGDPPCQRWLAAVTYLRCEGIGVSRSDLGEGR